MVDLSFNFRESTQEEILIFSEEFSNECRLNPEVKFYTAILQDENYAIFATKEEDDGLRSQIRILLFLILEHQLRFEVNPYRLFCAFAKEMTCVYPSKENLGKSKRLCWNLQDEQYHMYFEEVIYKKGGDSSIHTPHFYKDGLFVQYDCERNAWKEKVNHVDRYCFEQKLSDYSEEEKSPEWYSDYEYAIKLRFIIDTLCEMYYEHFEYRRYDRKTKKIIPFTKKKLKEIEESCARIIKYCAAYSGGNTYFTPFLQREFDIVKESSSEYYDKIWKSEDINEPYFLETKAQLARMFRMTRGLKLPDNPQMEITKED